MCAAREGMLRVCVCFLGSGFRGLSRHCRCWQRWLSSCMSERLLLTSTVRLGRVNRDVFKSGLGYLFTYLWAYSVCVCVCVWFKIPVDQVPYTCTVVFRWFWGCDTSLTWVMLCVCVCVCVCLACNEHSFHCLFKFWTVNAGYACKLPPLFLSSLFWV